MPFPLLFDGFQVPASGGLGFLISSDLARGGGTVRAGEGPRTWLGALAREGRLDTADLVAVCHALLAAAHPGMVVLAAQLISDLRLEACGPLLVAALHEHDLGLLLTPIEGRSVESHVAEAAARVSDLRKAERREVVYRSLRNADLNTLHAQVLVEVGTPAEMLIWGPELLLEGDPSVRDVLAAASREELQAPLATLLGR